MFNYMTTDFSTVEMTEEQEVEAEGTLLRLTRSAMVTGLPGFTSIERTIDLLALCSASSVFAETEDI
ncbi:hypothetical protein MAR_032614 [Mya arenaria]|uniref:Uncharacterized protein n=1 Tax=Mya arenaria TaxID=6604 RepID=A0ABY7F748_MYAAR|nr:hypothetical protein MAR_032614 [Mya arenaria]